MKNLWKNKGRKQKRVEFEGEIKNWVAEEPGGFVLLLSFTSHILISTNIPQRFLNPLFYCTTPQVFLFFLSFSIIVFFFNFIIIIISWGFWVRFICFGNIFWMGFAFELQRLNFSGQGIFLVTNFLFCGLQIEILERLMMCVWLCSYEEPACVQWV